MGLFWKRANAQGAFAALIVGFGAGLLDIILRVAGISVWFTEYHFLYLTTLRFVLSLATLVIVSLLTAPPATEKTAAYIWTKQAYDDETIGTAGCAVVFELSGAVNGSPGAHRRGGDSILVIANCAVQDDSYWKQADLA